MATLTVTAFDLLAGDQITAGLPSTTTITSLQHLVAGGAYVVRVVTTTLGTLDLPGGRTFTVQRTGTGPDEPGYDAALDAALAAILANTPTATGAALASSPALRAALVPFWAAGEALTAGAIRVAPDGTTIQRNANGTARPSYDATEAALWTVRGGGGSSAAANLAPTATKTAAYTVAKGELAVMDVANGATALTLPASPADGDRVGFWAIGATTAVPLVVTRGGSATIGSAAATSITVPLAGEETVYQYQAAGTRWVPVNNVKPLTALDGRYLQNVDADELIRDTIGLTVISGSANVTVVTSDVNGTTAIAVASEGSFRTMSDRQRIPVLTKLAPTVATRSQIGLNTIYVPWMIRVPDAVFQAYPALGRYRIYTSTDHDVNDGGVAVLTTTATDPTATDTVWTPYRTGGGSATIFIDGTNRQTETPCVVYEPADPAGKPFRMYYQIAVGTTQTTRVARSADGVTNWEIIGDAIPNLPQAVAGWNHTGYARVWFIDGLWCAFHLMGAGVGTSDYGWSYSYDGLNFVTERAAMTADLQDTDGVLRLGLSGLFEFRGQLWVIGRQSEYTSGPVTSTVSPVYTAPINDDLRSFKGRPQLLSWPLISGELSDSPPAPPTTWVTLDDGRLVGAYRVSAANASNDSIRLAVLS